jgi:uncharacterized protein YkwD
MPHMIFHGFSIAFISKSFFSAVLAIGASLLMAVLSGCIASPRSQHIDYVIAQKPQPQPQPQLPLQLQPAPPVLTFQHIPPEQPYLPLRQAPSGLGDATCTSASHLQSDMLDRVNRIRAAGAVCGGVRYPPTGPVRWNSKLQQAAAVHSQDMAMHNFFNHKSATNGTTLTERLSSVGYRYQAAGENIGAGPATVAQVVDMWVASPGHCVILMTANFVDLGASCKNNSNSHYKSYWTLKAATPS